MSDRIDIKKMRLFPFRGSDGLLYWRGKDCEGNAMIFRPYRDPSDERLYLRGLNNRKDCPEDSDDERGSEKGFPVRPENGTYDDMLTARAATWCQPCAKYDSNSDGVPDTVGCHGSIVPDGSGGCVVSLPASAPEGIRVAETITLTLKSFSDCCNDDDPGTSDSGHTGAYHGQIRGQTLTLDLCTNTGLDVGIGPCGDPIGHPDCGAVTYSTVYPLATFEGGPVSMSFPESCDSDGDCSCHRIAASGCPDCAAGDTDCICSSLTCDACNWNSTTGECEHAQHISPGVSVSAAVGIHCWEGTWLVPSRVFLVIRVKFDVPPYYQHYESCVKQEYVGCFDITEFDDVCGMLDDDFVLTTSRTCGAVDVGEDTRAGHDVQFSVTVHLTGNELT